MNLNFECIQCGKCCHNLKLPLSVDEAIRWAGAGNQVQILCEATPWPSAPDRRDIALRFKGDRAFPAASGDLPVRITAILVAAFDGPCPYLKPDMLCGNYADRPRVCRIYPAEIAPHLKLDPDGKICPAEAWSDDRPPFIRDGELLDPETLALIEEHRTAAIDDVAIKSGACFELGITRSALANEGYVVHIPTPARLVQVLEQARASSARTGHTATWEIITNRKSTLDMLNDAGSECAFVEDDKHYIGFFPPEPSSP